MRPGEQPSPELIAGDRGARPLQPGDLAHAWAVLGNVMDPEVPMVSVVELGIVRDLGWQGGHLHVVVTPTYSGCPATEVIEQDIAAALEQAGFAAPQLERRLTPAWTTDWLSASGRERLRGYGIAPPEGSVSKRSLLGEAAQINCPQCGSAHTERLSEFGSTACKALYRCRDCLEPFDYFKCI